MVRTLRAARFKAESGGNHPLQDVISEHFELRAGSGLAAEIPIDVGMRDAASTGLGLEKVPEMAGDVPVRYTLDGPGLVPEAQPQPSPLPGDVLRGY